MDVPGAASAMLSSSAIEHAVRASDTAQPTRNAVCTRKHLAPARDIAEVTVGRKRVGEAEGGDGAQAFRQRLGVGMGDVGGDTVSVGEVQLRFFKLVQRRAERAGKGLIVAGVAGIV